MCEVVVQEMKVPFALSIHFLHLKLFCICHYQFHPFKTWMIAPKVYTSYWEVKSTLTVSINYSLCPKISGGNLMLQGKKHSKGAFPPWLLPAWGVRKHPVRLSGQINPAENTLKCHYMPRALEQSNCLWTQKLDLQNVIFIVWKSTNVIYHGWIVHI